MGNDKDGGKENLWSPVAWQRMNCACSGALPGVMYALYRHCSFKGLRNPTVTVLHK